MEEWIDIVGFEGYYQVSDLGRIKSIARIIPHPIIGSQKIRERIMSPSKDKDGYKRLKLRKNGEMSFRRVNILVAQAFIPNPENKPLVNHLNGVKDDNRKINLGWATLSENVIHCYENLNPNRGNKPIIQLSLDGTHIKRWDGVRQAGAELKLWPGNISYALSGRYKSCGGFKWTYE